MSSVEGQSAALSLTTPHSILWHYVEPSSRLVVLGYTIEFSSFRSNGFSMEVAGLKKIQAVGVTPLDGTVDSNP